MGDGRLLGDPEHLMRPGRAAAVVVVCAVAGVVAAGGAGAQTPGAPGIDRSRIPADVLPGPEGAARQTKMCASAGVLAGSDLTQPPPPEVALRLDEAHRLSTGAGVLVAVIDTGVRPQPRLPNLTGGGDYVVGGGDGLSDCDAHGTLIAGIIGAAASPGDGFVGVAPHARIVSIRQSSDAFSADLPAGTNPNDPNASRTAGDLRSLAKAVVHAANLGARVINISVVSCLAPGSGVDQAGLGAALWYAAAVRDAVIVSAAGNTSSGGSGQADAHCEQNPPDNPGDQHDPRGWGQATTLVSPAMFTPYVLSAGFTSPTGTASEYSLRGPWVGIAAPGTAIVSLSPSGGDGAINGVQGQQGGDVPVAGSSYAAAYVSGTAALLRAKFPQLSAAQIMDRLTRSAHSPARGVDNTVGSGLLDPVAALTADIPVDGSAGGRYGHSDLVMPAAAAEPDRLPRVAAGVTALGATIVALLALAAFPVLRRRKESR
ncbi:type VII secretion-associated serine protease mycosin [Aldersonia sp. NBC_00410]|uniref:type VII secretion-associated serine protease mycosin n=1 Tax=Aldersonia sp. NBC_00410 TaxID=2975954 RepID=UPI002255B46B|nr:type VII secretion-associated serine protease mycosin [Aldersonia sp. NBC_00410]MCX5046298.1 type VII secretion-associated serine protease mycosin [Aldersonia sp. NBC_00410]